MLRWGRNKKAAQWRGMGDLSGKARHRSRASGRAPKRRLLVARMVMTRLMGRMPRAVNGGADALKNCRQSVRDVDCWCEHFAASAQESSCGSGTWGGSRTTMRRSVAALFFTAVLAIAFGGVGH